MSESNAVKPQEQAATEKFAVVPDGYYWVILKGATLPCPVAVWHLGETVRLNVLGRDNTLEEQDVVSWGQRLIPPDTCRMCGAILVNGLCPQGGD